MLRGVVQTIMAEDQYRTFETFNPGDTENREGTGCVPTEPNTVFTVQTVPGGSDTSGLKGENSVERKDAASDPTSTRGSDGVDPTEDKENTDMSSERTQEEDGSAQSILPDSNPTAGKHHRNLEDAEVLRRAREDGCVTVVFPGAVTQDGCCRFVSEILKCILYQRQQLPMTYNQLLFSQRTHGAEGQDKDVVSQRGALCADVSRRKGQKMLQELEEVLQHLEELFSLSQVPRVLLLLGGSLVLPKELYEINMEELLVASGDRCLRVSSCLRQLFRTLFVADLLSDTRPVRLTSTTVLAMAHRDCGVEWFRPKLQFKVPTRVKNQRIVLSTEPSSCEGTRLDGPDESDYVWFQAPVTITGFNN